jgi:hypothetical protein
MCYVYYVLMLVALHLPRLPHRLARGLWAKLGYEHPRNLPGSFGSQTPNWPWYTLGIDRLPSFVGRQRDLVLGSYVLYWTTMADSVIDGQERADDCDSPLQVWLLRSCCSRQLSHAEFVQRAADVKQWRVNVHATATFVKAS